MTKNETDRRLEFGKIIPPYLTERSQTMTNKEHNTEIIVGIYSSGYDYLYYVFNSNDPYKALSWCCNTVSELRMPVKIKLIIDRKESNNDK